MCSANWNRELVADLSSKRARLRKSDVMRFTREAPANSAGLSGDEFAVLLVAKTDRLACQHASSAGSLLTAPRVQFRAGGACAVFQKSDAILFRLRRCVHGDGGLRCGFDKVWGRGSLNVAPLDCKRV
jgi:hypothetical protein